MARFQAKPGLKHQKLIEALATQPTIAKAALAAGISKRTLYRRLQEPEFQDAYREVKGAAVSQSMARLQYASSAATSTLLKLMVDPRTPASVKARVADSILNHAVKATEMEAVQARAQTAENEMGSTTTRRIEQGFVLGIVADTVLCYREPVGNPVDVTAAEPCRQALNPLQEFFQERRLIAVEGTVESMKKEE